MRRAARRLANGGMWYRTRKSLDVKFHWLWKLMDAHGPEARDGHNLETKGTGLDA